jgi:hypothetical protein
MNTYSFVLLIRGTDILDERYADALFEAGCDDALFGERSAVRYADFDREGPSLAHAVSSAIQAIETAVPGARVVRVEPDDFVTLAGIARRVGRSRESVRLLSEGLRGPGKFPEPVSWIDGKQSIWQWADVAAWFESALGKRVPEAEFADFLAAMNAALELRWRSTRLSTDDEREEVARLLEADQQVLAAAS